MAASIGFEGLEVAPQPESPSNGNMQDTLTAAESSVLLTKGPSNYAKQGLFFNDGICRIDYVLALDPSDTSDKDWKQSRKDKRDAFLEGLAERGVEMEVETECVDKVTNFVKLHVPFEVCLRWAENMGMQLPIEEIGTYTKHGLIDRAVSCCCSKNIFDPDIEDEPDQYTAPFIQAKLHKFLNYDDQEKFFTNAQRSRICYEIMSRTAYGDKDPTKIGVERLLGNKSFTAAYPLHEGGYSDDDPDNVRKTLVEVWGSWTAWYKFQPLDQVRTYFGEKIGIYFAWLGYYTAMLIPVSIIGTICFIIGLGFINSPDNQVATDICDIKTIPRNSVMEYGPYIMCPLCDGSCDYWSLDSTCTAARVSFLFDNGATVFFAVVMAFWATFFLEFWKRKQAELAYDWDVMDYEEEEEKPRALFEAKIKTLRENPITGREEAFQPRSRYVAKIMCAFSTMVFMIALVVAVLVSVIIYRVAILTVLNENNSLRSAASFITTITAAVLQLLAILVLNKVYEILAIKLTAWELHRTQTEHDDSFTFKMFLFQFANYYGSIFYIAFFKGRFVGHPGNYNRIASFRLDECSASGCLIELTQQLAIIMVGKQVLNNTIEIFIPRLKVWMRRRDNVEAKQEDRKLTRWEEDYDLADLPEHGLFYEYLEMVIQFGFVTLFVAAFPLAPLFALMNNILEIRVDSNKFATQLRRPLARRAEDIGIWYSILDGVGNLSVITNAVVIAITSDIIPRTAYMFGVEDKPMFGDQKTLEGYVFFSLSQAPLTIFEKTNNASESDFFTELGQNFHMTAGQTAQMFQNCSFRGFRETSADGNVSEFKRFFWHVLAARLAFMIVFEHVVFGVKALIAWLVPDVPLTLHNRIEREKYLAKQALREFEERSATSAGAKDVAV